MSRRHRSVAKKVTVDYKYKTLVVAKFINYIMFCGKKGTAEKIVYKSLDILGEKTDGADIKEAFLKLLENVKPRLEVKSRRIGGSNYQIPVEVREERQICLALKWIVAAARSRSGRSMVEKLSAELFDAYQNRGEAVKKRENIHKMAEANRAFAHYIW